jgi:hypothetical protein
MKELLNKLFGHWHNYKEIKRTDWIVDEECECGKKKHYYPL